MNGSGRKRPLEGDDRQAEATSPYDRKNNGKQSSSKVQMSLFSFGFGPSSGNKRRCTEESAPISSPIATTNSRAQDQNDSDSPQAKPRQTRQTPPKESVKQVDLSAHQRTPTQSRPALSMKSSTSTPAPRTPTTPLSSRPQFTPSRSSPQCTRKEPEELNINHNDPSSDVSYAHLSYSFLQPNKIRDIDGRRPDHPEYDPKTLYVPNEWLRKETPAMQQWWACKQKNMDAILFFKMGKFYELFNHDAVVGINELDLRLMKSSPDKPAHAGFPESSRDKYERLLVEKGYKVMRIEQTETPAMLDERRRTNGPSGSKVVMREVCQVTTSGTRMWGISDSEFHSAQYQYLLALSETVCESEEGRKTRLFGVCFLDVTIGKLYIGQFEDDNNLSNLNLLLAHIAPAEILYERSGLSQDSHKTLLKTGARLEALKTVKEWWSLKTALSHLKTKRIFSSDTGDFSWPEQLKALFQDGDDSQDILSLDPREEFKFALDSLGPIIYYLESQYITKAVLAHATFEVYVSPLDHPDKISNVPIARLGPPPMVMDHVALRNLEIFVNSSGTQDATLFNSINYCKTHFGQRLLKTWICSPLCDVDQIKARQEAVEALMSNKNASLMNEIVHLLSGTKDLERMLSKIKNHCFKSDSDTRAIMFDGNQLNKAKVSAFVTLLSNFKRIQKFIHSISSSIQNCDSKVLRQLLSSTTDGGLFPDYSETVKYFEEYFDHAVAQKTGQVIPADGVNKEYDKCNADIERMKEKLEGYLEKQKSRLGCRSLAYFGSAKNRYQLQVPDAYVSKVPGDWRLETGRAGCKRYYTPAIDEYFAQLTIYEEQMKRILDSVLSGVFEEFLRKAKLWSAAIDCVASLDVLQSMAKFARSLVANSVPVCRPTFIEDPSGQSLIEYKRGFHPTLVMTNPQFIDNDLTLDSRTLLLSGANMGGKSTLMRQTALFVVLAQLGCPVPAAEMRLTPVDRIFSRLGASDRLLEGESTFFTELVETSAMLRCASNRSLLLLDELGRGTSTFDGTAIAYSVIKEISKNLKCRCLFSTHYHTLTRDFEGENEVRLAHMACKIENETADSEMSVDPLKEDITFLYKVTDGPAARSYGFNVAKLAGIHKHLIAAAYQKSKEMELNCKVLATMQNVCRLENIAGNSDELRSRVLGRLKAE